MRILRLLSLCSLVLTLLVAPAFASPPAASPTPLDGLWLGSLNLGVMKLRLLVTIGHEGADWKATITSLDQGGQVIPVQAMTVVGDKVSLTVPSIGATYAAARSGDDKLTGQFTQRGATFPLELLRTDKAPVVERPQTPKPPFPYDVIEVTAENRAAKVSLACSLTKPRRAGKLPAALLITGSGPQDRDESIMGHKPFAVLADALTRKGILVMRCDDRGTAHSTGDFTAATTLDFAGDVEAELAQLRQRADVDGAHVGLIGHSEGGVIAPLVAARTPGVGFVVMLAGTGLRGDEIIRLQEQKLLQGMGATPAEVSASLEVSSQIRAHLLAPTDKSQATKEIHAVWEARPPILHTGAASDQRIDGQLPILLSTWYRAFLRLDPAPSLRKLTMPVLAINGERDVQVLPKENLAAIAAALAANHDATVRELPGLNHLFQTCKTGMPAEYAQIEETMAPAALELVGSWVAQHTGARP